VLTRWIEKTPLSIGDYPALKPFRVHMEADEGVKQALVRQAMEPIG
jgi:glutathione S-transferase